MVEFGYGLYLLYLSVKIWLMLKRAKRPESPWSSLRLSGRLQVAAWMIVLSVEVARN